LALSDGGEGRTTDTIRDRGLIIVYHLNTHDVPRPREAEDLCCTKGIPMQEENSEEKESASGQYDTLHCIQKGIGEG